MGEHVEIDNEKLALIVITTKPTNNQIQERPHKIWRTSRISISTKDLKTPYELTGLCSLKEENEQEAFFVLYSSRVGCT